MTKKPPRDPRSINKDHRLHTTPGEDASARGADRDLRRARREALDAFSCGDAIGGIPFALRDYEGLER